MSNKEDALEMGKRPSRQRRHLPTSISSAAKTRSTERRNISLLKMDFDQGQSTGYQSRTSNNSKQRRKPQAADKEKARQFVAQSSLTTMATSRTTSIRKLVIYGISSLWVLFVLYRIYLTMNYHDLSNLSVVHFVSKKLKGT